MTQSRSFMKALFHGVIEEDLIFPFPELPIEESKRVDAFLSQVDHFSQDHVDSKLIDLEEQVPEATWDAMREIGLFGAGIPSEFGGLGFSASGFARVMQCLGGIDASVSSIVAAHQNIGVEGLLIYGNRDQKERYLPKLATGETIAAFALTEAGAGSDAASISTHAVKEEGGYRLRGKKVWVTNGNKADLFTVFARTAQEGKPKITAFLVERGEGVTTGESAKTLGVRGASSPPLFLDDVWVPDSNVLGIPGHGFQVAMEILNRGRLGSAASSLGACRRLISMALARTKERRAFGRPIIGFGMIKEKVAHMMCDTYALESMTYLTTGMIDRRKNDYSLESAICKIFGSETHWRVANETMNIAAGLGYARDYPYERMLRDARLPLIFQGTNEILRAFIALAGLQGPGTKVSAIAKAMREPIKGFGVLSEFALGKARGAFGRDSFSQVHPILKTEAVMFEECVDKLAREAGRILRKHGTEIAEMQLVQRRLAEVTIDLFAIAAVLMRTTQRIEQRGEHGARRQTEMARGFCVLAGRRTLGRLNDMERDEDELMKHIASKAKRDGYVTEIL